MSKRALSRSLMLLSLASAPVLAEPLNYNVVSFNESASTTINKDLLTVSFRIQEDAADRQKASNTVTQRLNALLARVRDNKAFKSELTGRSAYPRYNDKQKLIGYTDVATVQVESKDFQALNKLVAASQNEAALDSMSFSVSPEKRSEAIDALSKTALKNFTARAKSISQTLGFGGNYKIVNINIQSDFRTFSKAYGGARAAEMSLSAAPAAAPEMNIEDAGSEEIIQTINGSVQM